MSAEELRAKIREIPDFPKPGHPVLRHHDAAQGPGRLPRGDRPDARAVRRRADRHRRRDGVARLHLQRADGLPARRRPGPGPQAGQAAGRDDHRRVRPRVRLEHARDPPRRDPARPEGPHRGRPARDRRAPSTARSSWSSGSRARSSAWPSSSSSTSSRAATGWTAAGSPASSSTEPDRPRRRPSTDQTGDPPTGQRRRPSHAPAARRRSLRRRRQPPSRCDLGRRRFFRAFAGELVPDRGHDGRRGAGAPASVRGGRRRHPRTRQRRRRPARAGLSARRAGAGRLPDPVPRGRTASSSWSTSAACPTSSSRYTCRSAGEVAYAIREMVVRGAPAIGQVAAIGLALTAAKVATSQAVRAAGDAPRRGERPASTRGRRRSTCAGRSNRVMARYEAVGDLSEDGDAIAAGHARRRRTRSSCEATTDHGRAGRASGSTLLPTPDGRPLRVLTHCNTGPLACGQFGTALGVVQAPTTTDATDPRLGRRDAAVPAGRPPDGVGARPRPASRTRSSPTSRPGYLMARGEVDVILVGADRIAANGDTANKVGTYPLAVLAARHGIPFYVVRPDQLARPGDAGRRRGSRSRSARPDEVLSFRGVPHRAAGHAGPQPGVRRHAGRAHHRDRHRGGRRPGAVRAGDRGAASEAARARRAPRLADAPGVPSAPPRLTASAVADGDSVARRSARRRSSPGRRPTGPAAGVPRADRLFAAYAICDLDEREFARTRWGVAWDGDEPIAVVLEYDGSDAAAAVRRWASATGSRRSCATSSGRALAYVAAAPGDPAGDRGRTTAWIPGRRWSGCGSTGARFRPYPASVAAPPARSRSATSTASTSSGFAVWLPPHRDRRGRLLRDPRQRPLVAAAGTHVVSPDGAPGGRRQRPDPRRLPRSRLRHRGHRRRDRRAAADLRPGRAQRPLRQPAGAQGLPPARLPRARPLRGAPRPSAAARPGRPSTAPLRAPVRAQGDPDPR